MMPQAAKSIACWADPHLRSRLTAGTLSGPKARLLLGLVLRDGGCAAAAAAFAPYQ